MTDCPALRRSATSLDRDQAVPVGVKLAESRLRPPEYSSGTAAVLDVTRGNRSTTRTLPGWRVATEVSFRHGAQLHVDHSERHGSSVIRAVFFDLDGTLVDSDTARDTAVSAMFPDADADVTGLWRDLEDRHFNAYLAGEISHSEQRRRRVADLHAALDRPAPSDWFTTYLLEYQRAWIPFPDALPTLAGLDLTVGVLTNGRMDQQHAKLKATGLRDHIKALLTSHELGVAKPAPAAFHAACQAFRARPDEVMYVGDRIDVDARPAIVAGLHGVWLNRRTAERPAGIATITSLLQLPHLIDVAN